MACSQKEKSSRVPGNVKQFTNQISCGSTDLFQTSHWHQQLTVGTVPVPTYHYKQAV